MMAPGWRESASEEAEIDRHDSADEHLENKDEFSLGDQIGFAGLVDELGNLEHRPVHREPPKSSVRHEAEEEPKRADADATGEQAPGVRSRGTRPAQDRGGRDSLLLCGAMNWRSVGTASAASAVAVKTINRANTSRAVMISLNTITEIAAGYGAF